MTNLSVLPKSEISAQKCHSCSCSLRLRVWDSATSMMLCIARWPVSQWNGGVRMAKYETYVREPRERSGEQRLKTHQFGSRGRVAVMISVVSSPTRHRTTSITSYKSSIIVWRSRPIGRRLRRSSPMSAAPKDSRSEAHERT